jgi:cytoskeletal protein CcmA (bactofilin family)
MFLNNKNGNNKNNGTNGSFTKIGKEVKIEGKFHFKGPVIIDGTIIGSVKSEGLLTIAKSGNVESNLKASDAVIAGNFNGDLIASGLVIIKSTGKFIGNLTQKNGATLVIEKGGLLKGKSLVLNGKKDDYTSDEWENN